MSAKGTIKINGLGVIAELGGLGDPDGRCRADGVGEGIAPLKPVGRPLARVRAAVDEGLDRLRKGGVNPDPPPDAVEPPPPPAQRRSKDPALLRRAVVNLVAACEKEAQELEAPERIAALGPEAAEGRAARRRWLARLLRRRLAHPELYQQADGSSANGDDAPAELRRPGRALPRARCVIQPNLTGEEVADAFHDAGVVESTMRLRPRPGELAEDLMEGYVHGSRREYQLRAENQRLRRRCERAEGQLQRLGCGLPKGLTNGCRAVVAERLLLRGEARDEATRAAKATVYSVICIDYTRGRTDELVYAAAMLVAEVDRRLRAGDIFQVSPIEHHLSDCAECELAMDHLRESRDLIEAQLDAAEDRARYLEQQMRSKGVKDDEEKQKTDGPPEDRRGAG